MRKPWLRIAALGSPVLPLVNVNRAGADESTSTIVCATEGILISSGGAQGAHPPRRKCRGMRRRDGEIRRSHNARGLASNATGGDNVQQRARCARPAEGSRNMATAPRRKTATRATYSPADIGWKISTGCPGRRPAARRRAAAFCERRSRSAKVVTRRARPRPSIRAAASGRVRACCCKSVTRFTFPPAPAVSRTGYSRACSAPCAG